MRIAGGGGASDIRLSAALDSRLVVAGGAGGGTTNCNTNNPGGDGGTPDSQGTAGCGGQHWATGATQTSGGTTWVYDSDPTSAGAFGVGASGGGGGGGGWWGGASAGGTGGVGGSSHCNATLCSLTSYAVAASYGNGSVVISYIRPTFEPTARPSVVPSSQPSTQPSCLPSSEPTMQPSSQVSPIKYFVSLSSVRLTFPPFFHPPSSHFSRQSSPQSSQAHNLPLVHPNNRHPCHRRNRHCFILRNHLSGRHLVLPLSLPYSRRLALLTKYVQRNTFFSISQFFTNV